jgi:hypothetical protein
MVRAVQHRGEPMEWLKSLGFNTIKLSGSPSAAELREAHRLGLWLIAPPPYADHRMDGDNFGPVIAWSLGSRLSGRDIAPTHDLLREIRALDPMEGRPLIAGADAALAEYSRVANLLLLERPTLATSAELADLRQWALGRMRLARPGTIGMVGVETQRTPAVREQLILLGRGAPWEEDCEPQQLRLQAFQAISAGARGIVFQSGASDRGLSIDNGPAALRTDAIRLVNMELRLLEPWIAAGQLSEELAAEDGSVQVSVLGTDRSRLLVMTQHSAAQQYVLGPPPRSSLSMAVQGVGVSDQAYLVSLAGIKPLKISRGGGGARIALEDAPHAAAIVITQDPLAIHHLQRTIDELRLDACWLRYDLTARRLAGTAEIDQQLVQLGHPLAPAASWLQEAQASLEQARGLIESRDFEKSHAATSRAEHLLARVRRGHWEQAAAGLASPAATPCASQFTALPLHWAVAERLRAGPWGPNVQTGGDMESLDGMLRVGWQQQRQTAEGVSTDVTLSLGNPHAGRSALRMQAWPEDPKRAVHVPDSAAGGVIRITSSPVRVRQGQVVRIGGWVNVPRRLTASTDGLLIYDSIGGPDLGERVRLTQGWREFTLDRAVPQSGELTITFAITGLGEASIDDLSVSLLDPEPIRAR